MKSRISWLVLPCILLVGCSDMVLRNTLEDIVARARNPTYTVTYSANGATSGSVPTDSNKYLQADTVTVIGNTGSLVKTGNLFAGWNTKADGSGTTYTQDQTFSMGTSNVILYAAWISANKITAFNIVSPAATGSITGTSIVVTVPYGTNVTALVANFTTRGASVSVGSTVQTSGVTANNFTNPVTYTVTAADSSTQNYSVTVTVALNTAKAITAFSIVSPYTTGTITGNAIAVLVPHGTDVSALAAYFTTTGVSVKVGSTVQTSGTTTNDFTNPVVCTVTAADSSTQSYTVTVALFATYTTANGLGSNTVCRVAVSGSTIYASTGYYNLPGGLSISTNGGVSWINYTTANGLADNAVNDVAVSGSTIYAATWEGLSASTNGGSSWTTLLGNYCIMGIAVSGSTICGAVNPLGVVISTNGGATWNYFTSANGLGGGFVSNVAISGSTIYAATGGGLSVSTNGGTSWMTYTTTTGLGHNDLNSVTVSGSTIYVATYGGGVSVSQ